MHPPHLNLAISPGLHACSSGCTCLMPGGTHKMSGPHIVAARASIVATTQGIISLAEGRGYFLHFMHIVCKRQLKTHTCQVCHIFALET
mmetsp:Transcript_3408/g.5861  ORF Transcript_3408/g.5861 Transcript_3408/m.5861 type:complete len:89 (-) Transcript_3408:642-908(-)